MKTTGRPPARAVVADIGGTNARFAVADLATLTLSDPQHLVCAAHPSLADAARAYLSGLSDPPAHAALAVAAPVTGDWVQLTNSPWSFSRSELSASAGFEEVLFLNDFQALAYSLPYLEAAELQQIGGGEPVAGTPKLVLGPGTGLGVAGLVPAAGGWIPVPSEGGHISLAAETPEEFAILDQLRKSKGRVSVERALSGPGLADLYDAIATCRGRASAGLEPHEVVAAAQEARDPIAVETLERFVNWLARFAGDAALFFGARGGVYLGGGITPRILSALTTPAFREGFEAKGRMRDFLAPVPLYAILAHSIALKGAAAALALTHRKG